MRIFYILMLASMLVACNQSESSTAQSRVDTLRNSDSARNANAHERDSLIRYDEVSKSIVTQEVNTGGVFADTVVNYALSLQGIPYKYASIDPAVGFDCSGFITYVFNKYGINVPRSSKDFENVGTTVMLDGAKRGDLILFTGTDSTDRTIGHMGIITNNDGGEISFVHSTSGKANGVTETLLGDYYMKRYVKTIRVFNR